MNPYKFPLLFHAVIEGAAAVSFMLTPTDQLPGASPEALLILRSYGGLLLSSSVLCYGFFSRPRFDEATVLVAASTAIYHLFPIGRACVRLWRGRAAEGAGGRVVLGGPAVHLAVHVVAFVGLWWSALYGRDAM